MTCEAEISNVDKFLILPIHEGSKSITQALSKEGAFSIMESLSVEPLSSKELSGRTGLSVPEVEDCIVELIGSGLIEVKNFDPTKGVNVYVSSQRFVVYASDDRDHLA